MNLRRGLIKALLLAQIVGCCPHMDAACRYRHNTDGLEIESVLEITCSLHGYRIAKIITAYPLPQVKSK